MTPAIDTRRRNAEAELEAIEDEMAQVEADRRAAILAGRSTREFYAALQTLERRRKRLEGWVE